MSSIADILRNTTPQKSISKRNQLREPTAEVNPVLTQCMELCSIHVPKDDNV